LPATLHKYSYAGADPVNRVDPSGKDFFRNLWVGVVYAPLATSALRVAWELREEECMAAVMLTQAALEAAGSSMDPNYYEQLLAQCRSIN